MGLNSINTSSGVLLALAQYDAASAQVAKSEDRISTGLKVASARDDGAAWSIAQNMRSQVSDWQVVSASLNTGQSILDVAASGAAQIGDLLKQLKAEALSYTDPSLSADSQAALQADMTALIGQIDLTAKASEFEGQNLLNGASGAPSNMVVQGSGYGASVPGPGTVSVTVQPPSKGTGQLRFDKLGSDSSVTVVHKTDPSPETFTFHSVGSATVELSSGAIVGAPTFTPDASQINIIDNPSGGSIGLTEYNITSSGLSLSSIDWSNPSAALSTIGSALTQVTQVAAAIGTQQSSLSALQTEANAKTTALQKAIGDLVDADMTKEAANLKAAQARQGLAAEALGMANAAPQWLLSLFR